MMHIPPELHANDTRRGLDFCRVPLAHIQPSPFAETREYLWGWARFDGWWDAHRQRASASP